MKIEADASDVSGLLAEQRDLLWSIHQDATDPPGKAMDKADLAAFLLCHGLHIRELAKAALVLMESREPYSIALLGRSALESAFNMKAAMDDRQFGPQRIAYELEDLAKKLKLMITTGVWPASRKPTPDDCLREAGRIRQAYNAPAPTLRSDTDRIRKIEEVARTADLSPYYEDEYRQLSLTVHSNQAGVLNAGSGFLVRKGMLAISNAAFIACQVLAGAFRIKSYDAQLSSHHLKLESLMQKPEFAPTAPTAQKREPND